MLIISIFVLGDIAKELNLKVMLDISFPKNVNFGVEYNDKYLVVVNGNKVVFSDSNKKPALRSFSTRKKSCNDYVEFWYQSSTGRCTLLDYVN